MKTSTHHNKNEDFSQLNSIGLQIHVLEFGDLFAPSLRQIESLVSSHTREGAAKGKQVYRNVHYAQ